MGKFFFDKLLFFEISGPIVLRKSQDITIPARNFTYGDYVKYY